MHEQHRSSGAEPARLEGRRAGTMEKLIGDRHQFAIAGPREHEQIRLARPRPARQRDAMLG
jgi:hypothetical protein